MPVLPVILFLLFSILSLTTKANGQGEVIIPAGTFVSVESTEDISSRDWGQGQKVPFKVSSDVIVGGQLVIRAGTQVEGTIKSLTERRGVGKPAKMTIELNFTRAIDGTMISLSSCDITKVGKERKGLAIGLGVGLGLTLGLIFLSCLAIKGKHAKIDAGYSINCYVASNTVIKI